MTAPASSASPPTASAPKSGGSAVRLLVLIGILALAVGMWFYDYSYAGPGSESKYKEIDDMVIAKNAKGVKDGGLVTRQDVAAVVGFQPTYVEQKPDCTIEWYCWWGKIPVLSTWKRYITVVYIGNGPHFNTHHKNEPPPEEALPGYQPPPSPMPEGASPPEVAGGDLPGGMKGGEGPGKGKKSDNGDATPPGDKPAEGDKPVETKPAEGDKPAETKPAEGDKPAEANPAEAKGADEKPADAPKADDKPKQ